MTLGACYSLSDLTVTKRSAIKFTPADLDDGPSATEFGAFVVRDIETMKETLGIDLKIDANYLSFGGASASFDLENSVQQRTDSLTVVIKTSTTFGRKGITDDSLRPEAQALLGDAKSFIDAFGTYVIDQVTLGASVSAVLTISDVDTSTQNDISTELAAHGGSGPVSGGLTAKVNQEIQRAANSGRLSINLFATGGPGQFSGEVSDLAGHASLAMVCAGPEGCTAYPFDLPHLRALLISSADIGEVMMRAFILRRAAFLEGDSVGSVIVGEAASPETVRLRGLLTRNSYPHSLIDADGGQTKTI